MGIAPCVFSGVGRRESIGDPPDPDRAQAQRLIDVAHQIRPSSNVTRDNVDVGPTLA